MRKDIISKIHTHIREGRVTRRGATIFPEFAEQWQCKEYERFPKIQLDQTLPTISLGEALKKRESHPKNILSQTLTRKEIELLLTPLGQKERSPYRYYPSGGALYPIETYLISSFEGGGLAVYHYNPKAHVLEKLWAVPEDFEFSLLFEQTAISKKIQAAFIFTAYWERSAKKYGDFAYNLALLEAGHMAQNVLLAATELPIEICPMGGFSSTATYELLNIENNLEQAIYSLLLL